MPISINFRFINDQTLDLLNHLEATSIRSISPPFFFFFFAANACACTQRKFNTKDDLYTGPHISKISSIPPYLLVNISFIMRFGNRKRDFNVVLGKIISLILAKKQDPNYPKVRFFMSRGVYPGKRRHADRLRYPAGSHKSRHINMSEPAYNISSCTYRGNPIGSPIRN